MPILKDLAQVLRVHEQGNTSLVAVLLGRRLGQFRVHVKGARRWPKKGFEGGMDLLARGEILVYPRRGETLWVFREWDERARPRVGRSLATLRVASFLCELAEALTRATAGAGAERAGDADDGDHAGLYEVLAAASDALARGAHPGRVALLFALRALAAEGLEPDLRSCSDCGAALNPKSVAWLHGQGLCCPLCAKQRNLTSAGKMLTQDARGTRGTWLAPEAQRWLHAAATPSQTLPELAPVAARQLAYALLLLVHGALEHDLRTLANAAKSVALLGQKK